MESLLSLLSLKQDATSTSYLSYLTSISLDQIYAQSNTLNAEYTSINQSLTALALRESQAFSSSSAQSLEALPEISEKVETLTSMMPALDEAGTFDSQKLQRLAAHRKEAALLGRNESRLQEILDIPGLVKACVLKGHYSEATELNLHLSRIQARHPRSKLLQSVLEETQEYMQRMTLQLLVLLNSPLKLAMAIKIVGLLRRSGHFQDRELKYLFLKGRYDALVEAWAAIETLQSTPEKYVKKYVEIFRDQAFAIITQYNSIFPEDKSDRTDTDQAGAADDAFVENLLSSFTQRIVQDLRGTLQTYIPQIQAPSTKTTLLTQIIYTSQSLARVGCEFIGLVVGVFGDEKMWSEVVMNQRQMARRLE